ncbi:hypothetical protein Tco_0646331 [Tanacetum coccineum]
MIFPRRTCCFEREYVSLLPLVAMTAVREVNERVTYLATTQGQETHELQVRCEDAHDDRALLRAQTWGHSESRSQAIKAQIRALQRDVDVLQRQRIKDEDRLTSHILHEHDRFRELVRNVEAGASIAHIEAVEMAMITMSLNALTWWNSHVKTVGHDAAYGMPCKILKKMMTDKYCPRGEIKKDEVKKYVRGLLDMIQGSVMASKPKTMQDAIEFATKLMDKKIHSLADRKAENKRKLDDTSSNNHKQP